MIIKQAGITYDIVNSVKNIGEITFDLIKANDMSLPLTEESELARLYLEILGYDSYDVNNIEGVVITVPGRKGINPETATFSQMREYLDDITIKQSESKKELVRRIMAIRFPTEFNNESKLVSLHLKNEYELIHSQGVKDVKFLGEVGFTGKVRLDKSVG